MGNIVPGAVVPLNDFVVRITAPNPGAMTGPGTNSYIVGREELALIDPGPENESHRDALLRVVGKRLKWILCTHTHLDHSPGAAAYSASKAAALALMGSLAAELSGSGVRVNSVLPSVIDTAANRKSMPKADFAKWPKPAEIARVILFLCSDDAEVIHGAAIPVYGAR